VPFQRVPSTAPARTPAGSETIVLSENMAPAAKVRHERASIAGAEPDMGCAVRTVLPQGAGADRLVAVVRHDHHCKAAACVSAGVRRADPVACLNEATPMSVSCATTC
jgi:hypothetical protein